MTIAKFIHMLVDGYLVYLPFEDLMSNAVMNNLMWIYVFIFHGQTSKRRELGHLCKYIFNFVRNYQTALQSSHRIFHLHQQYMKVPAVLYPWQHVIFSLFNSSFSSACLMVSHCRFSVCIFLMTKEVEHLFMCYLLFVFLWYVCERFVQIVCSFFKWGYVTYY